MIPNWEGNTGITVTLDSITYGVIGKHGLKWLDKNLGASQVATNKNDTDAQGWLYQWGRLTDGHQIRTSETTNFVSLTDSPGHGDFIISSEITNFDWKSPKNDAFWQGELGTNNPGISIGFRVPTELEIQTEINSWGLQSFEFDIPAKAFLTPLKWCTTGIRNTDGTIINLGRLYIGTQSFSLEEPRTFRLLSAESFAPIWSNSVRGTASPIRLVANWKKGDRVKHNQRDWVCFVDNTTQEPGAGKDWGSLTSIANQKTTTSAIINSDTNITNVTNL